MRMQDCPDCQGTGIGWPPPDADCVSCGGRGYRDVYAYEAEEADERWFEQRREERWGGDAA